MPYFITQPLKSDSGQFWKSEIHQKLILKLSNLAKIYHWNGKALLKNSLRFFKALILESLCLRMTLMHYSGRKSKPIFVVQKDKDIVCMKLGRECVEFKPLDQNEAEEDNSCSEEDLEADETNSCFKKSDI